MRPAAERALLEAFGLYLVWTAATWLLEGLPGTLVRPEALGLRLAYAIVANLLIGILLPFWLLRRRVRAGWGDAADYGFSGALRTALGVGAGGIVGFVLFRSAQTEPVHPLVVLNAFAQVWVVSVAEVVVCWALVGASVYLALRERGRTVAGVVATLVAAVLFGLYHFAHSPPFNEPRMVAFLSGIGIATGAWWFASRDVYGTSVFHNFFGVTGVLAALKAGGLVPDDPEPAVPLIITALVVTVALVVPGVLWMRKARDRPTA